MDIIYKIAFITINVCFLILYIVNFIISLIRDRLAKKRLVANPQNVEGKVKNIQVTKKTVYVTVEFTGPSNLILFSHTYEYYPTDFQKAPLEIGQTVNLIYNDVKNLKKIHNFPLLIEGSKVKLEKGPLFSNIALIIVAGYLTTSCLISILSNPEKTFSEIYTNSFYILIVLMIYVILMTYVVESLFSIPKMENHAYLKVNGFTTKARVITFKLGGSKNNKGFKESRLTIEFRTNTGERIETNLSSYMYTETQEEYIDVVYDPKNPKNVVYLRQ